MKIIDQLHPANPNKFGEHKRKRKYNPDPCDKNGLVNSERRYRELIENYDGSCSIGLAKKLDWYVIEPTEECGTFPHNGQIVTAAVRILRDARQKRVTGHSFGSRDGGRKNQNFPLAERLWNEYLTQCPEKINHYWSDALRRDLSNREKRIKDIPTIL